MLSFATYLNETATVAAVGAVMMYRPTRERSYGRTADLTPQAETLCARIAQEGGAAGVELIEADADDGIVLVAGLIAAGVPEARLISNAMRVAHAMDAARATDMWQRGSHEAAYARLRKPCEAGGRAIAARAATAMVAAELHRDGELEPFIDYACFRAVATIDLKSLRAAWALDMAPGQPGGQQPGA